MNPSETECDTLTRNMPQWSVSDANIRLHVFLSSSEVRKRKRQHLNECELGVGEELFRASTSTLKKENR